MTVAAATSALAPPQAHSPRTLRLLEGPILGTLLALAWPNTLVMLAQAATGLIETWWVAKLGTDALAGMALTFPLVMLSQMISAGAMGGGISSAVARALGGGRREEANDLVLHALLINGGLGALLTLVVLLFGRPIYQALGGSGGELEAALTYSNVVFAGNILLWVMNAQASLIRGTGNMLVPALVICGGVVLLVPLSPCLIFGVGPFPALGIAGGGAALVLFYIAGTMLLGLYLRSTRSLVHLRWHRPRWPLFRAILGVGAIATLSPFQTNLVIALTTALVGGTAGAGAVAGYGTGARLEYLLVPLVFGLGAPLVAMVGTNIGAGQHKRALRVALVGGAIAFTVTETLGLVVAIWPEAWLLRFTDEPAALAAGAAYLRLVGPVYGFFGLGLALYFASQGAGRLFWPLAGGALRVVIAAGGGWAALAATQSLDALFAALAVGIAAYGLTLTAAVASGVWFRRRTAR